MIVYRMHGAGQDPFDTTGSFLNEGRWHSAGVRVIYAAQHASLAVFETLLNVGGGKLPPRAMTRIVVPDSCLVEHAPCVERPLSQRFGNAWIQQKRSAVLAVPSIAMNKMEFNFVLNAAHADFAVITHEQPETFVLDFRFGLGTERAMR
jgi:RES domain-containing protein